MTDWPGLGIVSPSASKVPGSAAWIVSETTGEGIVPYAVVLGTGAVELVPSKNSSPYAPPMMSVPCRTYVMSVRSQTESTDRLE